MPTIRTAWEAVERALDDDTRRALRPGATAARLAAAAKVLGKLPAALRALLARHDGMRDAPLFENVRLLGAKEIVATYRMRVAETGEAWIPITDADGDHVCLDRATGRVLDFRNVGAKARVIAPSLVAWLARVPRLVRAEQRSATRLAALLPKPAATLPKRERERLARLDGEHEYFVGYVAWLEKEWRGVAPEHRVVGYHPVARIRAADVVARAVELGYVERRGKGYRTTAKGRRVRDA